MALTGRERHVMRGSALHCRLTLGDIIMSKKAKTQPKIAVTKSALHKAVISAVEGKAAVHQAQERAQDREATLTSVCRKFVQSSKGIDLLEQELWDLSDDTNFGTPFHKLRLILGTVGYGVYQVKDDDGETICNYEVAKKNSTKRNTRGAAKKPVETYQVHDQLVNFAKRHAKNKTWGAAVQKLTGEQIKRALMAGVRSA